MANDFEAVRGKLRGPVHPVLPAFDANGGLDIEATGQYVAWLVDNGATTVIVTAGTSRLNLLTMEETAALNRVVAQHCAGRAIAVAGNPPVGSTEAARDLLTQAAADGAHAFLALYGERYYGDRYVLSFFEAMPMRRASSGPTDVHPFSLALIAELAKMPAVIGLKEENGQEALRQRILIDYSDRLAVVLAGGGMRALLAAHGFGATASLVGIGSFSPQTELKVFEALEAGRFSDVRQTVAEIERPFFDAAIPIGWHTALKASLALMGLIPPYERAPLVPPTSEEMMALEQALRHGGWLT